MCVCVCMNAGLEGDAYVQFLTKGGDLTKVKSNKWKKKRFYRLMDDGHTMWKETHKGFKKDHTCEHERFVQGFISAGNGVKYKHGAVLQRRWFATFLKYPADL